MMLHYADCRGPVRPELLSYITFPGGRLVDVLPDWISICPLPLRLGLE